MNDQIKEFYDDLRKVKDGKLAVFMGAGSSYDYGVPTMCDMAEMLLADIRKGNNAEWFGMDVGKMLLAILGISNDGLKKIGENKKKALSWNIEDLLTRLHQIKGAIEGTSEFPEVQAAIATVKFNKEDICSVEAKLLEFMINCFGLDAHKKTSHGNGSVGYIADFIKLLAGFQNSVRIFTTNSDLCVEAALVKLSQEEKDAAARRFCLIDGFGHGLISTFSIENFALDAPKGSNRVPVYLWKMHGSIDWVFTNPSKDKVNGSEEDVYKDESVICKMASEKMWKLLYNAGAVTTDASNDKSKIMIFPTPAKYSQTYTSPYMGLYEAFRRTLQEVEFLLTVGTSFPDRHINSAIKAFLKRDNTHLYLVDPFCTNQNLKETLGDFKTIKPVIKKGFKDFVGILKELEERTAPSSVSG